MIDRRHDLSIARQTMVLGLWCAEPTKLISDYVASLL
jgi:hypothetical protein